MRAGFCPLLSCCVSAGPSCVPLPQCFVKERPTSSAGVLLRWLLGLVWPPLGYDETVEQMLRDDEVDIKVLPGSGQVVITYNKDDVVVAMQLKVCKGEHGAGVCVCVLACVGVGGCVRARVCARA